MACVHGRISTSASTKRRIFASSGGFCQRPTCHLPLFPDELDNDVTIGEIAHVIAANQGGPRDDARFSAEGRARFANLILLCPNCHTMVDKAPEAFPAKMIFDWKEAHSEQLETLFGEPSVGTRVEVRKLIEPFLAENRMIHLRWGPDNDYQDNPEAEEARVWIRKMRAFIIPNSARILRILSCNSKLLTIEDHYACAAFKQHVDDLIDKHILGGRAVAARFPKQMENICR